MADRTIEQSWMTLDEFLALDTRVEIIEGELVEMAAVGGTHQLIGGNIYRVLDDHNQARQLGLLSYDGLIFLMFSIEKRLKNSFVPDIAFIFTANILPSWNLDKPYPGVPDLAIEIISPDDNPIEVMRKRRTYLAKGTKELWLVYPDVEEVHQYTPDGVRIYTQPDEAIQTNLFPDLTTLTLKAIFALPDWALRLRPKAEEEE